MAPNRNHLLIASIVVGILMLVAIIFSGLFYTKTILLTSHNSTSSTHNATEPVHEQRRLASFAFVGDLGCNGRSNQTLAQIKNTAPAIDRLILLGDYSYKNDWKCFQNELVGQGVDRLVHDADNSFKGVVVGNHEYDNGHFDHLNSIGRTEFLNYFGLVEKFGANNYSFDYKGVHFTVLDTGGEKGHGTFSINSDTYHFLEEDLSKSAQNATIQWRIVLLHKNVYSSPNIGHNSSAAIRDAIQPLADMYNVDLIINGHTHAYERTYPLKHNSQDPNSPVQIVMNGTSTYTDPEGEIFLTVGSGGNSHHIWIGPQPTWVAFRDDKSFGFLEITISADGKTLSGSYLKSDDRRPIDSFSLSHNS